MERLTVTYPERDQELLLEKQRTRERWRDCSRFAHLGTVNNGDFKREWTLKDFEKQIAILRKPGVDHDAFFRVVTRDLGTCMYLANKFNVSPEEYYKNDCENLGESKTYDDYLKKEFYKAFALELSGEGKMAELTDHELLGLLKVYNTQMEEMRMDAESKIEKLRASFISKLETYCKKNNVVIDKKIIETRFDEIDYDYFDEYLTEQLIFDNGSRTGDYDRDAHKVRVLLDSHGRIPRSALQHEHLHAISGQKNTMTLDYRGKDRAYISSSIDRLGASVERMRKDADGFKWLNEAITETINTDMGIDEDPNNEFTWEPGDGAYVKERALFKLLLTSGEVKIDPKHFYGSYFESNTDNLEDLTQRKELYKNISHAYGSPRFLVRLDDLVGNIGIDQAYKIFKESGKLGIEQKWKELFLVQEPEFV